VILSGGKTTVTVCGQDRSLRSAEFHLARTFAPGECPGIYALAADTDDIEGTERSAGAMTFPDALARGDVCAPQRMEKVYPQRRLWLLLCGR
jgi:hydroxypyruvate reductase